MPNDTRLSEAKRKLLELQRRGNLSPQSPATERPAHSPGEPIPLSPSQEQVWRLEQEVGTHVPLYNESITLHRHGTCDVAALEKAFAEIIRRHEIWRTTFEVRDGRPIQIVHPPPATFHLPATDLRSSRDDRQKAALELGTQDAKRSFDLSKGPLLRARLVTLSDEEHRLFLTAHQSIVDGVTVYNVFPTELSTLYESYASGKPSPLPELELQFADFACEQRRRLTAETAQAQLVYWQKQLSGDLRPLAWPNKNADYSRRTFRGAIHPFSFDQPLTDSLRDLARREGATLFIVLLAALAAVLHRYTQQDDIIIGTLAPSGRKHPQYQRLLGYFLNPVPLRTNVAGNPAFTELMKQAREATLGAISHDEFPMEIIAERLGQKFDPIRGPLFTVALSVAPDVAPLPPGWGMTFMDVESGGARWDLYLELSDRAEGAMGRAQYNPDIFARTTVQKTLADLETVLRKTLDNPSARITDIISLVHQK